MSLFHLNILFSEMSKGHVFTTCEKSETSSENALASSNHSETDP